MTKKTQREYVLQYLQDVGSITSGQAMDQLGCYRLASRICELRQAGHNIEDEWVEQINRYGVKVKFKRYYLAEPEPELPMHPQDRAMKDAIREAQNADDYEREQRILTFYD